MGSTWWLDSEDAKECTLWSGASKDKRYEFQDLEKARAKKAELDENFKFASTRHCVVQAERSNA